MNGMSKQAALCRILAERLEESVAEHEKVLSDLGRVIIGYGVSGSHGAGKCQIKADVVRLRRELQRLSEMLENQDY